MATNPYDPGLYSCLLQQGAIDNIANAVWNKFGAKLWDDAGLVANTWPVAVEITDFLRAQAIESSWIVTESYNKDFSSKDVATDNLIWGVVRKLKSLVIENKPMYFRVRFTGANRFLKREEVEDFPLSVAVNRLTADSSREGDVNFESVSDATEGIVAMQKEYRAANLLAPEMEVIGFNSREKEVTFPSWWR